MSENRCVRETMYHCHAVWEWEKCKHFAALRVTDGGKSGIVCKHIMGFGCTSPAACAEADTQKEAQ